MMLESNITADRETLEYWQQVVQAQKDKSKPRNSLVVVRKITVGGCGAVPELLADVIKRSRELARSAG